MITPVFNQIPVTIYKRRDINAANKLVYGYIYTFIYQGLVAFPSLQRIADECGMSKRAVQDSLDKLESLNLIKREQRFNQSSVYTLSNGSEETPIANPAIPMANPAIPMANPAMGVWQKLPPTRSMNRPLTTSSTKSVKEETTEVEEVIDETVNVTTHSGTSPSALPLPAASQLSRGEATFHFSIQEAKAYCFRYGLPFANAGEAVIIATNHAKEAPF